MAIRLSSYSEHAHTTMFNFGQNWDWPEFYDVVDKQVATLKSAKDQQVIIFDFSRSLILPKNLAVHCPAILHKLPDNVQLLLIVSYGNMMSQIHELVELAEGNFPHPQMVFLSHRDNPLDTIKSHYRHAASTQ